LLWPKHQSTMLRKDARPPQTQTQPPTQEVATRPPTLSPRVESRTMTPTEASLSTSMLEQRQELERRNEQLAQTRLRDEQKMSFLGTHSQTAAPFQPVLNLGQPLSSSSLSAPLSLSSYFQQQQITPPPQQQQHSLSMSFAAPTPPLHIHTQSLTHPYPLQAPVTSPHTVSLKSSDESPALVPPLGYRRKADWGAEGAEAEAGAGGGSGWEHRAESESTRMPSYTSVQVYIYVLARKTYISYNTHAHTHTHNEFLASRYVCVSQRVSMTDIRIPYRQAIELKNVERARAD
jgi:hypothetical protein